MVQKYQFSHDFVLIKKARDFAIQGFEKIGKKYNDLPFFVHLSDLQFVLSSFGITDSKVLAAAWLHDTVEDTPTTIDEIEAMFGAEVADIVDRVTNPKGGNRASRHAVSYPKIAQSDNAVRVKLADRISNVSSGKMFGMYAKEHAYFRRTIYREGCPEDIQKMWDYLDFLMES